MNNHPRTRVLADGSCLAELCGQVSLLCSMLLLAAFELLQLLQLSLSHVDGAHELLNPN